jgi:hypothetical protein
MLQATVIQGMIYRCMQFNTYFGENMIGSPSYILWQ